MIDENPIPFEELRPEEWLGLPTREELLEQQCRLLESECGDLLADLSRARQNVARLVDMHAEAESAREKATKELTATQKTLTLEYLRSSDLNKQLLFGMQRRDQMIKALQVALVEKGGDPDQVLYHYQADLKSMEG